MKQTSHGFAMILLAVGGSLFSAFAEDPSVSTLKDATTGQIRWGEHWGGPELQGAKSLEGKVVLLKIWGG